MENIVFGRRFIVEPLSKSRITPPSPVVSTALPWRKKSPSCKRSRCPLPETICHAVPSTFTARILPATMLLSRP